VRTLFACVVAVCALGACGDQLKRRTLDEAQNAALDACLDRVTSELPDLWAEPNNVFVQMGDLDQATLNQTKAGDFVFKYPNIAANAQFPDAFECKGNLKHRKIFSIESQQTSKRPAAGQVWSY
jgi:hypothetical protein